MVGMFGQKPAFHSIPVDEMRRRQIAARQGITPDEVDMDRQLLMQPPQAAPIKPKSKMGMFGAGANRKVFGIDSELLGNIGLSLLANSDNGGSWGGAAANISGALGDHRAKLKAAQEQETWLGQLDGMDLTPEERMFAERYPDQFMSARYADQRAGARQAQEIQDGTFYDPKTGQWNIKPELYTDGGFTGVNTGQGLNITGQRPESFREQIDRARVGVDAREAGNAAEAARLRAEQADKDRVIAQQNADTMRLNATKAGGPSGPPAGISPTGLQMPGSMPSMRGPYAPGYDPAGGARLIPAGIGSDGRYAPTDGDLPTQNGMPAPRFNTLNGVKNTANLISAEDKSIKEARDIADSLAASKAAADKFLVEGKDYKGFGDKPWNDVVQWMDPKTSKLKQLSNEATIGKAQLLKPLSNSDIKFAQDTVMNINAYPGANEQYAMRTNAISNRAAEYAAFIQAYRAQYGPGSVQEAQRYWDQYKNAVPIFDDNGDPNPEYISSMEFFTGRKPPVNPYQRKVGALEQRNVQEMSDDDILKGLGVK